MHLLRLREPAGAAVRGADEWRGRGGAARRRAGRRQQAGSAALRHRRAPRQAHEAQEVQVRRAAALQARAQEADQVLHIRRDLLKMWKFHLCRLEETTEICCYD